MIPAKYTQLPCNSFSHWSLTANNTRPTLERRKTLGHLRSINRNIVIHFANQSQTCQLLKILKNIFFSNISWKETVKWCNQSHVELIQKIHIDYQERHIYIYNMSSSCYNILTISPSVPVWSEFTGWAITEELSIRLRLRTFLISCGQKTSVKHCYVNLSSSYELCLAIICIDMDVIFDLSTAIQQF